MPFNFDDSEARKTWERGNARLVPAAGMRRYNDWRRAIIDGRTPQAAAELVGDCYFKNINKDLRLFTIRLTQGHRVLFSIKGTKVEVIAIGGHT